MPTPKKITRALAMSLRAKAEKGKTPTELVAWLLKAHAVKATVADVRKALSGKTDTAKGAGKTKASSSPAPSTTSQARAHARPEEPPPSRFESLLRVPLSPSTPNASDAPVPETKEGRVLYIAGQMAANLWPVWPESRAHRQALAVRWGVEEPTIRAYAAEAHRIVALDPDDRDQLRARLAHTFRLIAEEARAMTNDVTGLPDWGAVIKAYETSAKYAGIEFETKHRISGSIALDDLDDLRAKILGEGGDDGVPGAG